MLSPNTHKPQSTSRNAIPRSSSTVQRCKRKAELVDIGVYAIEHGEGQIVLAITHLIRRRGSHE
jgi:hypothetical protein